MSTCGCVCACWCGCVYLWVCIRVDIREKGNRWGTKGGGRKDFSAVIICVMGFIFKSSVSVYYFALNAFEVA